MREEKNQPSQGELEVNSVVRKFRTTAADGKNYLTKYYNLVSGYFDFAEIQAMRHNPMYMSDYVEHLDRVLTSTGEKLLTDAGKISHKQAVDKATAEYRKYQVQTISPVEEAYLESIKVIEKSAKKGDAK